MHGELLLSGVASANKRRAGKQRLSAAGWRALAGDLARVADLAAIALAGCIVTASSAARAPEATGATLIIGCLLAANILPFAQAYMIDHLLRPGSGIARASLGWLMTIVAVTAVLFALKLSDQVPRLWLGAWFAGGVVTLAGTRLALAWAWNRGETASVMVRRIAVVGLGDRLHSVVRQLGVADKGVRVVAALDLDDAPGRAWPSASAVKTLASSRHLEAEVLAGAVDQIVLALPGGPSDLLEPTMRALRHLPVDIGWAPELPDLRTPVLGVTQVGDMPLVRLLRRPLDGWRYVLKSVEDRVLAAGMLLLTAPAMLVIAVAVKLDSPGPIFYRQQRRGFSREPIALLKFRSMYVDKCDAPDAAVIEQASRDDPRVTPVGRWLRRTSLDELPQLFNVLRGEMSVIGPRPHAVAHDNHYVDLIDDYLGRHRVKPGMTGWAQVHGYRGETRTLAQMRRRIELDLEYINRWSLWLDLQIFARTLIVGFTQPTAY
ncbi:MAG: undecaprenyl-phosphate glucose phosphotransferase [Geminicoccaceae bacterium]